MKNTDFKIGNYLLDAKDRLCRVETITSKKDYPGDVCFKAPAIKGAITTLPHKPIPITKKELLKLGFYQTPEGIKNFGKGCWGNGHISIFYAENFCECKGVKPKYVHELQNLHFVLTKKELTYE